MHVPGRFLMAADIGDDERARRLEAGRCSTPSTGAPAVPNGSVGFRYGEEGKGRWNLGLGALDPVLSLHGRHERGGRGRAAALRRRRRARAARVMRRGVPAIRVGGRLVTTVLDLMLATYGVARDGLPGEWPEGYDDAAQPVHAGVAGGDHLGRPPPGGQGRARVRAQRGGQRRALDDLHGRGHQPLVSLRRDLPLVHRAAAARRLRRDQRRRLGALRRPGEDPHVRGLADARVRAGLAAPAAPGAGHVVVLPAHRAVAL